MLAYRRVSSRFSSLITIKEKVLTSIIVWNEGRGWVLRRCVHSQRSLVCILCIAIKEKQTSDLVAFFIGDHWGFGVHELEYSHICIEIIYVICCTPPNYIRFLWYRYCDLFVSLCISVSFFLLFTFFLWSIRFRVELKLSFAQCSRCGRSYDVIKFVEDFVSASSFIMRLKLRWPRTHCILFIKCNRSKYEETL